MKISQPLYKNALSLLILALGLGLIWLSRAPTGLAQQQAAVQTGFSAPNFSLETLTGQTIELQSLRGQVVLVNLWASWCPPCRAEMPAFQRAYSDYRDQGFAILAVNSTVQDDLAAAQQFVTEHTLTFPILLDREGTVTSLYQVRALPLSVFIGRDGKIREIIPGGPMDEALLRARIEKLLTEMP